MKYVGKLFGQIGRTRGYFDTGKTSGDWDALEARAERAEAELGKLQELHGCSQEMVLHWCEHAANRSLGLDQARAELTAEREKAERYRLATLKLDADLAAERARAPGPPPRAPKSDQNASKLNQTRPNPLAPPHTP